MKTTSICKPAVRILSTSVLSLLGMNDACAQLSLGTASGSISNNFDTLISAGSATWTDNITLPGWYAQRTGNGTTIAADAGSGTGGNLYSYGGTGSTDRALGSLGSGNTLAGSFAWGVLLQNTSGSPLSLGLLSYVGEQWRASTAPGQTVAFSYQISSNPITALNPNSDTGWTPFSPLSFTSPIISPISGGALDGNLEANQVSVSQSLSLTLQSNEYIMLRWRDPDHSGTDHGLAIDSFSLAWGIPISTLYWDTSGSTLGTGGSGTWDTGTSNWNPNLDGDGSPTTFASANPVVFRGTAGTVTVAPGGVTASAGLQFDVPNYEIAGGTLTLSTTNTINTAHPAGTFTTISAPIAGNNGLAKSGTGGLALAGANTFTGNVMLSNGVVSINAETALGAVGNDVSFAGGSLNITDDITLDAGRALSGLANLHVDATKTLTVNGDASFVSLVLTGPGTLALAGGVQGVGAITFEEAGTLVSNGTIAATNISFTQPSSTATIDANLDLGSTTRTVTVLDGAESTDLAINGSIKILGGSNSRLHKLGPGTLRLSGDNSGANGLTGSLQIGTAGGTPAAGGTVVISNNKALGGNDDNTLQLRINDGIVHATNDLTGANAIALGISIGAGQGTPATFAGSDMEFTGPVTLFLASATTAYQHKIRVQNTTIFSGPFNASSGGGPASAGISIDGNGTLILNAATNAVAEPIDVTDATLVVNGALSGVASVAMHTGATLSGEGSIAGAVTLDGGAALAPGNGVGTLEFGGALNLTGAISSGNGTLQFELGSAASSDRIDFNGIAALSIGTAQLNFSDFAFSETLGFGPGVYTLFSTNVAIDGTLGSGLSGSIGAFTGTLSLSDSDSDVILTVVPEPGSASLLLGGLACLAAHRRRREEDRQS